MAKSGIFPKSAPLNSVIANERKKKKNTHTHTEALKQKKRKRNP
jgi:hypothetical protein